MTDFKWKIGDRKTNALRLIEEAVRSVDVYGEGYELPWRTRGTPHDYYVAHGLVSAGYLDQRHTGPRGGRRLWPTEKGELIAKQFRTYSLTSQGGRL